MTRTRVFPAITGVFGLVGLISFFIPHWTVDGSHSFSFDAQSHFDITVAVFAAAVEAEAVSAALMLRVFLFLVPYLFAFVALLISLTALLKRTNSAEEQQKSAKAFRWKALALWLLLLLSWPTFLDMEARLLVFCLSPGSADWGIPAFQSLKHAVSLLGEPGRLPEYFRSRFQYRASQYRLVFSPARLSLDQLLLWGAAVLGFVVSWFSVLTKRRTKHDEGIHARIAFIKAYVRSAPEISAAEASLGLKPEKTTYGFNGQLYTRESGFQNDAKIIEGCANLLEAPVSLADRSAANAAGSQIVQHYASRSDVRSLFLLPWTVKSGRMVAGEEIPPDVMCDLLSGVEHMLLDIYRELPEGGLITDELVAQKVDELWERMP